MAVEQRQIQRGLVGEVAIEDRLGDPRGGGDGVQSCAVVAALAEQPAGGLDDQLAPLLGRQPSPRRHHSYPRVAYLVSSAHEHHEHPGRAFLRPDPQDLDGVRARARRAVGHDLARAWRSPSRALPSHADRDLGGPPRQRRRQARRHLARADRRRRTRAGRALSPPRAAQHPRQHRAPALLGHAARPARGVPDRERTRRARGPLRRAQRADEPGRRRLDQRLRAALPRRDSDVLAAARAAEAAASGRSAPDAALPRVSKPDRVWARTSRQHPHSGGTMNDKVNLAAKLATFDEYFNPKIVGELNDYKLELVKAKGEFVWHSHPDTDDCFLVLAGRLTIQLADRDIELEPGELFVVPRGLQHCPKAHGEAHVLLIEPIGTPNTGDAGGNLTSDQERI